MGVPSGKLLAGKNLLARVIEPAVLESTAYLIRA